MVDRHNVDPDLTDPDWTDKVTDWQEFWYPDEAWGEEVGSRGPRAAAWAVMQPRMPSDSAAQAAAMTLLHLKPDPVACSYWRQCLLPPPPPPAASLAACRLVTSGVVTPPM